ncbi:MAG: PQQ-dependent sugar dehydrogenase [Caldilineales bacterium]|nr:PQQ-dependent sugar dehydrogenase [Caldilineales bacterium]
MRQFNRFAKVCFGFSDQIVWAILVAVLALVSLTSLILAQSGADDGVADWAIPQGFVLEADATGFSFPSDIEFVPNPGPSPDDPAYFVAEIQGNIKVVTNDRTVHTFASDIIPLRTGGEFNVQGGSGLGSLCLDPANGYIFATYHAADAQGIFRNHVIRFETEPITFDVVPAVSTEISGAISDVQAFPNHQIGDCQVQGDSLFIGIGDGLVSSAARNPAQLLGKVVRLDLDGNPHESNPRYDTQNPEKPEGYVYAPGLRNPFGMAVAGERLFVADNGLDIDRLTQIEAGQDYLWDGSDWSIGARADAILAPSVGVTHLVYAPAEQHAFPPELGDTFFVGTSGESSKEAAIIRIPFDSENQVLSGAPDYLITYLPDQFQYVVALAVTEEGLYFAPLLPNASGDSPVFRLAWDQENELGYTLDPNLSGEQLVASRGCLTCHNMDPRQTSSAPTLNTATLLEDISKRLNSPEYRQLVADLDKSDDELFVKYRQARSDVLAASGEDQVKLWIQYRLQEPRFDDPQALMPNMNLSPIEAAAVAEYLVQQPPRTAEIIAYDFLEKIVPTLRYRHLVIFLGVGFMLGMIVAAVIAAIVFFGRRLLS